MYELAARTWVGGHSVIGVLCSSSPRSPHAQVALERHAMLVDQRTENVHVPLNALSSTHKLELANSSLSEMAVLGVRILPAV